MTLREAGQLTPLEQLREECAGLFGKSPDYVAKQLYKVPDYPVVDREVFILQRVKGKSVLDIGASGPMHEAILEVAKKVYSIDKPPAEGGTAASNDFVTMDLDDTSQQGIPQFPWPSDSKSPAVELVVCGEVLEHLSNPGFFLQRLRKAYPCPVVVSVPNAFTDGGRKCLMKGYENCNADHVAWYSPRTIGNLLGRVGYVIKEFAWYKGAPKFSEGMVLVAE